MRNKILQNIFSHFQMMTQWVCTSPDSYTEYYNKAKGLIEFLEVQDCGSVGGYDKKSPVLHESGFNLYDRFLALVRKNNTRLKKELYFTPTSMMNYWKQLNNLRETFNK